MECVNTRGTDFEVPFSSESMDQMICMPGDDYLDLVAWQKRVFIEMIKALDFEKAKR